MQLHVNLAYFEFGLNKKKTLHLAVEGHILFFPVVWLENGGQNTSYLIYLPFTYLVALETMFYMDVVESTLIINLCRTVTVILTKA